MAHVAARPAASLVCTLGVALFGAGCPEDEPVASITAFCLSPPEDISFGARVIRTSDSRSVILTNCGNTRVDEATLAIEPVDGDTVGAAAFTIGRAEILLPMNPGESFSVPIVFRPTEVRDYEADVVIRLPGREQRAAGVAMTGTGLAPGQCALTAPEALAFTDANVGQTTSAAWTLTNQGAVDCAVDVVQIVEGHDDFGAPGTAVTVPAGDSVNVPLTFSPTVTGARAGRVEAIVAGRSALDAALTGGGLSTDACVLRVEPTTVVFPRASVAFTTSAATATVRNVGTLPCSGIDTETDLTDFAAVAAADALDPGAELVVDIEFTPQGIGARSGVLTVTAAEGATATADLSAFGDPTPSCSFLFFPQPLSFQPTGVGLSREADVTFTNFADRDCAVDNVRIEGGAASGFSVVSLTSAATLAPGGQGTVRVRFTPADAAPELDRLLVDTTDATAQTDLVGFGAQADLLITPGTQHFETVTQGCVSRTYDLTLANLGPVAARVDDVVFGLTSDPIFQVVSAPADGSTINVGQELPIRVRMLGAPVLGRQSGTVEVTATGATEPRVRANLFGGTASVEEASVTDTFSQTERPAVDLLFVIDSSGSMANEQQQLQQNFNSFIGFTTQLDIDFHLGVVTTDMASATQRGIMRGPYIRNVGPDATVDIPGTFVAQANVGTSGSATEQGLAAAVAAITTAANSPNNQGFLRDDALLSVIIISDENDFSPGDVSSYVEQLVLAKDSDSTAVLLSAIAGDVPSGCNANGNSATAAPRYLEATSLLGGLFSSVCTPDWATTLEELGTETFNALTRFTLTRIPEQSAGITVVVNGVPVPEDAVSGWTFQEGSNAIQFHGEAIPDPGDIIQVSYLAECIVP